MAKLVSQINEKMNKEGFSAYSLERSAGLKANAVHNIISGRSKNPSINILQSIAKALNCSVSDLIGEEVVNSTSAPPQEKIITSSTISNTIENKELYIECLIYFCTLLRKHKCWLGKEKVWSCIDELYLYSLKTNKKKVDKHFAKWFFEKVRT